MKKYLYIFSMCLLVGLLSSSCSNDDNKDEPDPGTGAGLDDGKIDYKTIAFYYDWYGNEEFDGGMSHWAHVVLNDPADSNNTGFIPGTESNIAANFYPELGRYSNRDPKIIKEHMEMFKKARIGVAALSWWNENNAAEGEKNRLLLDEAEKAGVKVCFHIEPYGNRTASSVRDNIKKIVDLYGNHPAFYRIDDKPVFFIYDSYLISTEEWARLLANEGDITIRNTSYDSKVIGLWLNSISDEGPKFLKANFDGFYTYFSAVGFNHGANPENWIEFQKWAEENDKLFIPSVGPGYIDTRVRVWNTFTTRDRNNGYYYDMMYKKAIDANVPYISITSFNEWHEGTQIEPAKPYKGAEFTYLDYGSLPTDYYLTRTAYWVGEYKKSMR